MSDQVDLESAAEPVAARITVEVANEPAVSVETVVERFLRDERYI